MSRARVTAAVEPHGARARSRAATVRGTMRLPLARYGDVLGASRPHQGRAACGEELAEAAGRRGSSAIRRDTVALLLRSGSSRSGARRLAARVSLLRVGRELPAVQRLRRRLLLLRRVPKVALESSSTDLPRPFGRRAGVKAMLPGDVPSAKRTSARAEDEKPPKQSSSSAPLQARQYSQGGQTAGGIPIRS